MTPSWYDIKKKEPVKIWKVQLLLFFLYSFLTESPSFKATTKRSTQGKFKDP